MLEELWVGEDSVAQRFIRLLEAGQFATETSELAVHLAADLGERVHRVAGAPQREAVVELSQVCWGLSVLGGRYLDLVLSEISTVRQLLLDVDAPGMGAWLDDQVVAELLDDARWTVAGEVLEDALAAWPESGPELLLVRASLSRQLRRWKECLSDFELAAEQAPELGPETWLVVLQLSCGRVDLELALGRLDFAQQALEASRAALRFGVEASAPDDPYLPEIYLYQGRAEADFNLTAGRYGLVLDSWDRLFAGPLAGLERPSWVQFQVALAFDGIELEQPTRAKRAGELLERAAHDPDLEPALRPYALLRLAIWQLSAGEPEAAAAVVPEVEQLLSTWDPGEGFTPSFGDTGTLRMVESRIARASGASDAELRGHVAPLESAYADMLAARAELPILPGGLGFLHWGDRQEVLAELLTLRRDHDPRGAEAGLEDVLAGQALGSLARRRSLPVPSLEEIRRALIDGGGILVYVPSMRGGHILIIDEQQVEILDLPGLPALRQLTRLTADELYSAQAESTRALSRALLPLAICERIKDWAHLYVVGVDELHGVAFESLLLGAGPEAPRIGRKLPMARLPSLAVGVWLARNPRPPLQARSGSLSLLVATAPSAAIRERAPEFQPIEFGDEDRERLLEPFGGAGAQGGAFFMMDPTPEFLRDADFGSARILHILSHGYWDDLNVRPACLLFAAGRAGDDGIVDCADVEAALRDYPSLVILSACGAALGPERPGEDGVSHLGAAFLYRGARAVLLADQDLFFRGDALALTVPFHAELARGHSPAEALRRARTTQDHEIPMRLIGLAHRPLFTPREEPAVPWLLGSVSIATIGVLVWGARRHKYNAATQQGAESRR